MANLHFILQGKGGCGKSIVASTLAQHYLDQGKTPLCFDTDPVNRTFTSISALNVQIVDLSIDGNIVAREFDGLMEAANNASEDSVVIIDNGASTFLPLSAYLKENDAIGYLKSLGHSIMFHSVITGGQALLDTMSGLEALLINFPNVPVTVWVNEYFGKAEMNGTSFEQTKLFNNPKYKIHALITLKALKKETFGYDIDHMLRERLTFNEAIQSADFSIMAKQRLVMTQKRINEQITQANL